MSHGAAAESPNYTGWLIGVGLIVLVLALSLIARSAVRAKRQHA